MLYSQILLFFTLFSSFIISVSSEGPKFGVVKPPLRRSSTPTSASDPPFETPKISLIMILKKFLLKIGLDLTDRSDWWASTSQSKPSLRADFSITAPCGLFGLLS